ncbi:MAG: sigma-70 family RNA polymerase sigma factor [Gemmataceae bacterium]
MSSIPGSPASLLQNLCGRPAAADWERFVALFAPLLSRWGRRLGVPAGDLEDLLQEVFTLLVRKLPEFRYDPQRSFRGWLWTVFVHHAQAWRKRQAHALPLSAGQLEALSSPDNVEEAGEVEYRRALLDRAMRLARADFPETTWRIFWELAVEGRPGVEVARRFGVTPNAVYLARGRVLARLRHELAGLDL